MNFMRKFFKSLYNRIFVKNITVYNVVDLSEYNKLKSEYLNIYNKLLETQSLLASLNSSILENIRLDNEYLKIEFFNKLEVLKVIQEIEVIKKIPVEKQIIVPYYNNYPTIHQALAKYGLDIINKEIDLDSVEYKDSLNKITEFAVAMLEYNKHFKDVAITGLIKSTLEAWINLESTPETFKKRYR